MKPIRLPGPPRFLGIALLLGILQVLPEMPGVRAQAAEQPLDLLLNFDRRTATSANVVPRAAALPAERLNAEARLRDRLPALQLDRHPILDSPKWIASREGFLTGPDGMGPAMANAAVARQPVAPNDPHRVVKAFLNEHAGVFGHDASALERARISRDYVTAHSGMRTTVWQQEHKGIEVFEAVFLAHITRDGELVNLASQFVPDEARAAIKGEPRFAATGVIAPAISAADALAIAARHLGDDESAASNLEPQDQPDGPDRRQKFRGGAIKGEANVRLCWLPLAGNEMRLCWRMILTSRAAKAMFRLVVDATTGEVWVRHCLTDDISDATYRVFTGDSPTPFSPAYSTPGNTNQPATVARQLVTLAALDATASPNGWINDGDNETRGNNVDAHTDLDDDNNPDTPRPQGSPNRVFDFSLDLNQSPSSYRSAAVVNLFYWCNWMHDKLYALGFTEAAGNFQNNNFGRGGLGNDAVSADAQDGGGYNNANFGTPEDGYPPRMQMYLFDGPNPDRDGDLDATIILHEYTHGLSNRRVGGGVGISEPQSRGLGEGWSDFFALALLADSGDDPQACHPVGSYALREWDGGFMDVPFAASGDNYYFGIRRYPYSTDLSKNPLTFKDIDGNQADAHEGVPISPWLQDASAGGFHAVGEVWCAMLWECRAEMLQKHGFATGNQLILRLVVDGMGLAPANPTFVQARDAIFQADQVLNGGANLTELKRAFAKRGLGYYAVAPANTTTLGVVESFEAAPGLRIYPPSDPVIEGPEGGPFPATAKVFTLQNEIASSIGWSVFVAPPLEASALSGSVPGNQSRTVTITLDANAAAFFPRGTTSLPVVFSNHVTHTVSTLPLKLEVVSSAARLVEDFDSGGGFDLDYQSLTFTPEGAGSYRVCRDPVSSFPVSTLLATTLSLPPDGHAQITLSGGQQVPFFGVAYSKVYVAEDGSLTFATPVEEGFELEDHFVQPRVSALFRNLDTAAASRISWQQLPDRFVVTWDKVRSAGVNLTNRFQAELFFDGVIRLTYLDVQTSLAIVGLSSGGGLPAGFVEADFSGLSDCNLLPITVTLPAAATEGDGVLRGAGMVSVPAGRNSDTTVTLFSSDTTELTVPATVVLPARATNVLFDLTVINDSVRDGSQLAYVTASASGFLQGLGRLRVDDNENNPLTVSLPPTAAEGGGSFSASLSVPNPVSGVVTVFLEASRTNELELPPVAFIPAGQTSGGFTAKVIDDRRIDGDVATTVSASVPNWTPGADTITVSDNEDRLLRLFVPWLVWEGSGTLTNAGNVFLSGTLETNLSISLWTSNFFELLPLGPAVIPAGQTNVLFSIGVGDNADIDGVRQVMLTASAPGFSNAFFAPFIFDNDQPPEPSNPHPPHLATAWPLNTHLAWDAAEGELIVNGDFETGDFTGWTVGGYGGGGWVLNGGSFDPDSPDGPRPALDGNFSALAVQNGNGRRSLSQVIFVPEGATSGTRLRWRQELRNHAGVFAANHRFAIELRDAATDALLSTLHSTTASDPAFSGPTNLSVSLATWRGQRVRLVFVEEDALGAFNVHLDNISLIATSAAPTTYDVYFGNDTVPDETEYLGSTTNAFWDLPPLAGGLTYYWRVDSRRAGITNTGTIWRFTTAGTSVTTTALPFGSAWKYHASGANLGTGWRSPGYNDLLWLSGTAPLGFGGGQATTIGYATNDYTTFYFRRRLTVTDTNRLAAVTASLKRDDGAVVYINGVEAFRDNMPEGRFDYLTQASSIVTGADETNAFVHTVAPSLFIEGTNVIAVEVHQRDNGFPLPGPSPDLFFDLAFTFRTNSGNLQPTAVNWVQPADFSVVRNPTNLALRASVVDDNLIGARVEFFADGVKLGEDSITPYLVTWTNPPGGLRTLLAVATDAGGLSCTSAPLHVLVTPPPGLNLLTLVPAGSVWRYRENGEYPGASWTQLNYREPRDRSWASGPAQLGYGDGDEATVIGFGLPFSWLELEHPITVYFRHQFNGAANVSSLTLRVLRDDGVAVYLNGGEIFRNNLPLGPIHETTPASSSVGGADENTWLSTSLSPALLNAGANAPAPKKPPAPARTAAAPADDGSPALED
ncbi:MAG: M36 family metallopeptidase, partial [Verrucomicrobia bacterium]|nr:M36 family metallopeptidase [Verrucomicrobiota bacterium]